MFTGNYSNELTGVAPEWRARFGGLNRSEFFSITGKKEVKKGDKGSFKAIRKYKYLKLRLKRSKNRSFKGCFYCSKFTFLSLLPRQQVIKGIAKCKMFHVLKKIVNARKLLRASNTGFF